jgi:6-phosphogluconolactonase/glucosamine-6-phosphate isomerase/deaminase
MSRMDVAVDFMLPTLCLLAVRLCSMDEYVGLPKEHEQSYHYFMWENFFKHVSAAALRQLDAVV